MEKTSESTTQQKPRRRRSRRGRSKSTSTKPDSAGEQTELKAPAASGSQGETVPAEGTEPEPSPATSAQESGSGSERSAAREDGAPARSRGRRRGGRGRGRSRRKAETGTETQTDKEQPTDEGDPVATPAREKTAATATPACRDAAAAKPVEKKSKVPELPHDTRSLVINVTEAEECRIAIMHQSRLEELFMERTSFESHVGNIYKGRVTNVEPSIQAAFVDFGLPKNGFLHISDLQPQYFPDGFRRTEEVGRKTPRRDRPPIQKCLRRGQEVIVQVIKEGIGTKGPTLTTYISIPGRYLVMMPGMNRLGVSRKIEDDDARRKMRKVLDELDMPKDMGIILRTAGLDRTKRDLQRDLLYLQRLWKAVAQRVKHERAPCELYQESDLVIRTIRDVYTTDFGKLIIDDEETAEKVRDFLALAMPRHSTPVQVYTGHEPIFHKYGIETQIESINARHVPLPSGGSLVIDSTEALVAIDVNSGRSRNIDDAEESAYRINLEAAEEIARQLRLRDLGGLIICDFIDMRYDKNRRGVERALRDALKKHKERAKCLRTSQFGIIEITRQRMRPSIKRSIYHDCPHCRGTGLIKNPESMTLDIMRLLRLAAHHPDVESVEVRVAPPVATELQNQKRAAIHELEQKTGRRIFIRADANLGLDQHRLDCFDRRGGAIRIAALPEPVAPRPDRPTRQYTPSPVEETRVNGDIAESMFE